MCLTLPRDADHGHGHREAGARLARPRGVPAAAAALLDRRADEPVHLDVDRRHARRRAAGVPPGAAGQRPHRGARRRGGPAGAALHPLLGLPERLPGLRADRRPRLRVGLPGPDRRGAVAAAHRGRRTTPRCRTPRRCAAPATTSARSRSTSRRSWCTCGPSTSRRAHAGRRRRRRRWRRPRGRWRPRRLWRLAQRAARLGRLLAAAAGPTLPPLPPPLSGWTGSRDLPGRRSETFRDWWAARSDGA